MNLELHDAGSGEPVFVLALAEARVSGRLPAATPVFGEDHDEGGGLQGMLRVEKDQRNGTLQMLWSHWCGRCARYLYRHNRLWCMASVIHASCESCAWSSLAVKVLDYAELNGPAWSKCAYASQKHRSSAQPAGSAPEFWPHRRWHRNDCPSPKSSGMLPRIHPMCSMCCFLSPRSLVLVLLILLIDDKHIYSMLFNAELMQLSFL